MVQNDTAAVIHSDDIFNSVRDLYLSIVTDELTHRSPKSDVIFQGVDKLLRRLHRVDTRYQGVFANNDLGHGDITINDLSVRENHTTSFLLGIKSWKPRFIMFSHGKSGRCYCLLSGKFKGFLDGIGIDPAKIRFQLNVINIGRLLELLLNISDMFFKKNSECLDYPALEVTTLINPWVMLVSNGSIRCPGRVSVGVRMCIIQYRGPLMWTSE